MEPDEVGRAASETIAAAIAPPGQVATLIIPADLSWSEAKGCGPVIARPPRKLPSQQTISSVAQRMNSRTGLLLGGTAVNDRALLAAGKLAASTGVRVFMDRYAPLLACGRGRFTPTRIPYFPEAALPLLADLEHLILVESQAPVTFFGYPDSPSYLLPEACEVTTLAERSEDGSGALEALMEECGAGSAVIATTHSAPASGPTDGPLTAKSIGAVVAALLPESAIVSDEMISVGGDVLPYLVDAAPHDELPVTGGSIGQGIPVALGAAMACPDRKVVVLQADGSAMYTLQALWTIARENLDVVTVIFANRRYRILDVEMRRTGAHGYGERANQMIDIGRPDLDWVKLSTGMGVAATRATTVAQFSKQFAAAMAERGARLIEAVIEEPKARLLRTRFCATAERKQAARRKRAARSYNRTATAGSGRSFRDRRRGLYMIDQFAIRPRISVRHKVRIVRVRPQQLTGMLDGTEVLFRPRGDLDHVR